MGIYSTFLETFDPSNLIWTPKTKGVKGHLLQDIPSQNRPSAPPLPTTPASNQPPPLPVKQNQS